MADGITSIQTVAGIGEARQFQDLFTCIPFSLVYEDDSILTLAGGFVTAAIPGAALGDFVLISPELDVADMLFTAYVTATDVVTIGLFNTTGGTLTTFASGATLNGLILKPAGAFASIT